MKRIISLLFVVCCLFSPMAACETDKAVDLTENDIINTSSLTVDMSTPDTYMLELGNINGDDTINIKDATRIQKHVAGLLKLPGEVIPYADVDSDGYVTGDDVTLLQKYIVGIVSSLGKQPEEEKPNEGSKTLVAYFSCTKTTQRIAEYIAGSQKAEIFEIIPKVPYTEEDLAYYTGGRADQEQNDPTARPAINGRVDNMDNYDIIFLGYPIWHSQAPKIIYTFLESYDFSGKTIVPFCTSHSSGIGSSAENLHSLTKDAVWLSGNRFAGDASDQEIEEWLNGLKIDQSQSAGTKEIGVFDFRSRTVLLNSGYEMPIMGLGTYSLSDDECYNSVTALLKSGGRLIDTAYMYGNEAAVGRAIRDSDVPRDEIFVITKIYPGEQFENPEKAIQDALDKLDIGYIDMMLLHHPGENDVKAYKAMEQAVADGKIHSIGLSNFYVEELGEFLPQVNVMPALVQNEIHPYYQENDVIPYIQNLGIVVQGWYPFGGRGHTSELLGDSVISSIAQAHGVSSAQVILRWDLQKGVVVIPGSSNPDHIKENLDLFDFSLTEAEMQQINALNRNEKHDWY